MSRISLIHSRNLLENHINTLGQYDPEKSVLMKSLYNIDRVLEIDPVKIACTPKPGYVNQKLNEMGGY